MAKIYNNKISISFDVYGCPQRCKHCWLGHPKHYKMDVDEVISTFINIKQEQHINRYYDSEVEYLGVGFREPHYGNDYKELYGRGDEINGCKLEVEKKYELISLWRLVRDKDYIKWLKNRGINRAQLKVFGLKKTNDFFYGRKGAHEELVKGTNILLNNNIIPRWQIYYNKKGINELEGLLDLTRELKVWERVRKLGEEFNIHGFTFDSDGAGFDNHKYRIEKGDEKKIPFLLLEKSKEHFVGEDQLKTESELIKEIINDGEYIALPQNHWLWFFVTSDWNVYPNLMGIAPWWKLGNLKTDDWHTILSNYKNSNNIGLKVLTEFPVNELAKKYGNINGKKLYSNKNELINYWVGKCCREYYE